MYVCIYMYACMNMGLHVCMYVCAYLHVCMHVCMSASYMYVHMYVWLVGWLAGCPLPADLLRHNCCVHGGSLSLLWARGGGVVQWWNGA